MSTFNPWKARDNKKRSKVNVLTEKFIRECPACNLMRRMQPHDLQCTVCELGEQDFLDT